MYRSVYRKIIKFYARVQTLSNYKSRNTIKYLVYITPLGVVSFLSAGSGRTISDEEITLYASLLDKVTFDDYILADKGFLIEGLASRGTVLTIPDLTRGNTQISAKSLDMSREIAHVRMHVEQVVSQSKNFTY